MSLNSPKPTNKTSAAVVAGVAISAGAAALQAANASVSPSQLTDSSEPVADSVHDLLPNELQASSEMGAGGEAAVAAQDPGAPSIEQLVDAYLNDGNVDALNVDALSASDLQEHLPEPDLLQALMSNPGIQLAQAGSGGGVGLLGGGGSGLFGLSPLGTVGVIGGGLLAADQLVKNSVI